MTIPRIEQFGQYVVIKMLIFRNIFTLDKSFCTEYNTHISCDKGYVSVCSAVQRVRIAG